MERMLRAPSLEAVVVATSTAPKDDPIEELVRARGWALHRGSEVDVLSRYAEAARIFDADPVVRMTMDCPLIDPEVIDKVVSAYKEGNYDFVSNNLEPSYPHGLDLEVFSRAALEAADREAKEPFDREHVSPFIVSRPERFCLGNVASSEDLHHHRWTVDYPEDLAFVTAVYEALYGPGRVFTTGDVLTLLEQRPDIARINAERAVS